MQENLHVTVAALVENEGYFLMVHEQIDGLSVYNQPAGHLEENETLIDAVVRECREETAWEVQPMHITGIYQWTHPQNQQTFLRVAFAVEAIAHHSDEPLDKEIMEAVWLSRSELEQKGSALRSPLVLRCVDDYLQGQQYPLTLLSHIQ